MSAGAPAATDSFRLQLDELVSTFVDDHCKALTQKLPYDFLEAMPLGASCTKYYGRALRLDENGVHYVDSSHPEVGVHSCRPFPGRGSGARSSA